MPQQVVIIGAVALGPKTACRFKRLSPDSRVIMLDRGKRISYGARAITKGGLRQEGEAYILRGDAYSALNENAPATADWEKAATFPSTKTMAEQRIRAIKGGVKLKRASRPKTGAGTQ